MAPDAPTEGILRPTWPNEGKVINKEAMWLKLAANPPNK